MADLAALIERLPKAEGREYRPATGLRLRDAIEVLVDGAVAGSIEIQTRWSGYGAERKWKPTGRYTIRGVHYGDTTQTSDAKLAERVGSFFAVERIRSARASERRACRRQDASAGPDWWRGRGIDPAELEALRAHREAAERALTAARDAIRTWEAAQHAVLDERYAESDRLPSATPT